MLSIGRTKELLNDPDISDEKAEKIRDAFNILAEVIFEQWQEEKIKTKNLCPNNSK